MAVDADIFWSPAVDPAALILAPPTSSNMMTESVTIEPVSVRVADEGLYLRFVLAGQRFVAVSIDGRPPNGPVAVVTPIDSLLQDRVDALFRFRDALVHQRAKPDDRVTPQRRRHLVEILRAIDGRRAGATYQEIAEAVFDANRVSAITWKSMPLRDTVMRRVRTGFELVTGGYRTLLFNHRPQ